MSFKIFIGVIFKAVRKRYVETGRNITNMAYFAVLALAGLSTPPALFIPLEIILTVHVMFLRNSNLFIFFVS